MNNLYPLKFKPIYKDKIWGGEKINTILNKNFKPLPNCGESWEISGVQGELSKVANGFLKGNNLEELIEVYLGDLVGDHIYEKFGIEFPLLIKFIDANDDLSIQVHPNDELSKERHNAYGKTEMWYVIQSEKGAKLNSGFNKKIDKENYLKHLEKNTLTEILNYEVVESGDVYFMPAGRVHAIGKGILLAEIQQTSDVTYRIYDYNRKGTDGKPRELHTELAVDAIDYSFHDKYKTDYTTGLNKTSGVVDCEYFTTNIIELDKPVKKDYNHLDSFVIYICLEGGIKLTDENEFSLNLVKGETVLIPAVLKNLELYPSSKTKILEVFIK